MSTLAKTFGMVDPPEPESVPVVRAIETEEQTLERGTAELDAIVRQGLTAMRETFEKAGDWKPSDANRAREVGAQIMKATIDAIKQKQDVAARAMERRTRTAQPAPAATSTTNIFTDRNTVLRLLRESGVAGIVAQQDQVQPEVSGADGGS